MPVFAAAKGDGPAVTPYAPELFQVGPLVVTNAMVYGWLIMAGIAAVVILGTRRLHQVPVGLQNFVEAVVEGLEALTKSFLEPKVARWAFPLIASFFVFILISNYMGLMPGVGSLGWGVRDESSKVPFAVEHVDVPFFRPPTADINTTIALALVFFVMSTWWALKYNGVKGLFLHIFGPKGGLKGFLLFVLAPIFFLVGVLEVVSILIRPVALSARLFGNIYGGENVLTIMLGKAAAGIAAIPFYFLEFLIATVQATVFTILCIAFISTLCSHHEDGTHHGKEDAAH